MRITKAFAAVTTLLAMFAGFVSPARAAELPDVFVSEITPDHAGVDNFEYFEITNASDATINLADYAFDYIYTDSADEATDVALTVADHQLAPGESVVVWLQYTSATVDSFAKTEADFRTQWGDAASTYPIITATGQPGMANGGNRGIRITDASGATNWSYYPSGSVSTATTAHFQLTAAQSQTLLTSLTAPTPGSIDAMQLDTSAAPTPEPTPEPSPEPTVEPAPVPEPDPNLKTSMLQITELLPDSSNVGGSDGYEFIEIYNAGTQPVDFSGFKLNYLYPASNLTINNSTRWPSEPDNPVIQPGKTLVLWVKNANNQELTYADFNAKWGTNLAGGTELVEIQTGGMANGGIRGMDVITNTGITINRVFYNVTGDDTTADQGIQYKTTADPALSEIIGLAPASPGVVTADQIPGGLMVIDADTTAPVITDTTPASIPADADFGIKHTITDDQLVRTATIELRNSADGAMGSYNLVRGEGDVYEYTIPAADLIGKRWYEYKITASDGINETSTEWVRVAVEGTNTDPVRLNVEDGEFVSGTETIVVGSEADAANTKLSIDGTDVTPELVAALEDKPVFVFEADGVNAYFQNGVRIGEDVLGIFDRGTPTWTTLTFPVDESYFKQGEGATISVWAGTKAAPEIDLNENNDDFEIRDVRLVLPDGRTLRPADFVDPSTVLRMGDSAGKLDFYDAVFDVPADAFSARGYEWDTTKVADGEHEITVTNGTDSLTRKVVVDNTAPSVTLTPADGSQAKGEFTVDAEVTDAGSGVDSVVATLDGETIELPHTASTLDLAAGEHVFQVTARDKEGNSVTTTSTFTTAEEQPGAEIMSPEAGAQITPGTNLTAAVTDPTNDALTGGFFRGWHLDAADNEIVATGGVTDDAASTDRSGASALELGQAVTSENQLPYNMFTVDVPADAGDDYRARIKWDGELNEGQRVSLNVLTTDGTWERVDETIAVAGTNSLEALVPAVDHAVDGKITVLVQHSDGWAGANLSEPSSNVTPFNAEAEPRSSYDFTVGWMSDTQYYNANVDWYHHQMTMNKFLVEQRENLNLQYVVHTGDIVDNNKIEGQFPRADEAYKLFDEANLPYGVLAGNHDVSGFDVDYTEYGQYFGDHRFEDNPWFGGSHMNNRGHYDLFSAGGIDFIHVYMGWGAEDAQIDWMNEVLAKYPERVAIVNLHEYMLTTGGLGALPQRILDEVVATNPNVKMVQSGHYHDAYTRTDSFDDNGDGVDDRTVYSMLFDYQGLDEGGLGFIRLMHFDNEGQRIMVRTYSPSLDQFNADDSTLEPEHQTFDISYADLGIKPESKSLTTTGFSVDILSTDAIGTFENVPSGSLVNAEWPEDLVGEQGFYVVARDEFGGEVISEVREVTVVAAPTEPTDPVDPTEPTMPTKPGRPDHAGKQGPPPHANKGKNGKGHDKGKQGPPAHIVKGGKNKEKVTIS